MSERFHDSRVRKYGRPMYVFSVNCYTAPYRPIWIQFEEVAFSVNCYSTPHSRYGYNLERFILTHVPLTTPSLMIGLS